MIEEEEAERQRKASVKTIPLKELEVGGIYETTEKDIYVYLGNRKMTFKADNDVIDKKEGNCFVYVSYIPGKTPDEYVLERILDIDTYWCQHNIKVLKGNKKLTKMIGKVDLEFPLIKTGSGGYRWNTKKFELTID
jgi:hypothetical protein